MERMIFIFGDSITYGAWDIEGSGWANRLRRYLDKRAETDPDFYAVCYNLGVTGETSDGLLKRLKPETRARFREKRESIFIFAYGTNDAALMPGTDDPRTDIDKFGENMEAAIKTAGEFNGRVVLINIAPVNEDMTMHPKAGYGIRSNASSIDVYNRKLAEIAEKHSLPLVDVNSAFMRQDHKDLLNDEDGLHPNAKGHEIIFGLVKDQLEKMF
ncbi:GDSL-type esterase/lipase family protein [Patescibacteria group bacterium]|nr:GDSL-type esterase/lipase family protein [Patescibacteria group bacterium]